MSEKTQLTDSKIDTIPTNLRLLLVLEQMAQNGVPMTPTEVNQSLQLPKPTIHRLFATLEEEGFLQREIDGRSYAPGRRLRNLAASVISSLRVRTARVAVLTSLAEEIGETCNLALPDRDVMRYLDRVETKWPLRIQLPIGTEVPFYCTASGKMYLSSLTDSHLDRLLNGLSLAPRASGTMVTAEQVKANIDQIRQLGYSSDDEEFMDGMIAVAVPISDQQGRLFSTLSFHAPKMRMNLEEALVFLPALKKAAKQLSLLVIE